MATFPDECPITFEAFTEKGDQQPLVLPKCGHTFSKIGISELVAQARDQANNAHQTGKRRGSRPLVPIKCPACSIQQNVTGEQDCPPNWFIIQGLQNPSQGRTCVEKSHCAAELLDLKPHAGDRVTCSRNHHGEQDVLPAPEQRGQLEQTAASLQYDVAFGNSDGGASPDTLSRSEQHVKSSNVSNSATPQAAWWATARRNRQVQHKGPTALPACITVNRAESLTGNQVISNRFVLHDRVTDLAVRAVKAYVAAEDASSVSRAISELMIKQAETTDSLVKVLAKKLPIVHHVSVEWPYMARTRHVENVAAVTMRARLLHYDRLHQQLARLHSEVSCDAPVATSSSVSTNTQGGVLSSLQEHPSCAEVPSPGCSHRASAHGCELRSELGASVQACSGNESRGSKDCQTYSPAVPAPAATSNAMMTAAEALVATEIFEAMFSDLMCAPVLYDERDVHDLHAYIERELPEGDQGSCEPQGGVNLTVNFSLDGFEPQRVFTAASHYLTRMKPKLAGVQTPLATETCVLAVALLPTVEALLGPVLGHREIVSSIVSHAILVGGRDVSDSDDSPTHVLHACEGTSADVDSPSCVHQTPNAGGINAGVAHEGVISPRDLGGLSAGGYSNGGASCARDRSDVRKIAVHVCRVLAENAANADSLLALCSGSSSMHELPAVVHAALDYLISTDPDIISMARALECPRNTAPASQSAVSTGAHTRATEAITTATRALNFMHVTTEPPHASGFLMSAPAAGTEQPARSTAGAACSSKAPNCINATQPAVSASYGTSSNIDTPGHCDPSATLPYLREPPIQACITQAEDSHADSAASVHACSQQRPVASSGLSGESAERCAAATDPMHATCNGSNNAQIPAPPQATAHPPDACHVSAPATVLAHASTESGTCPQAAHSDSTGTQAVCSVTQSHAAHACAGAQAFGGTVAWADVSPIMHPCHAECANSGRNNCCGHEIVQQAAPLMHQCQSQRAVSVIPGVCNSPFPGGLVCPTIPPQATPARAPVATMSAQPGQFMTLPHQAETSTLSPVTWQAAPSSTAATLMHACHVCGPAPSFPAIMQSHPHIQSTHVLHALSAGPPPPAFMHPQHQSMQHASVHSVQGAAMHVQPHMVYLHPGTPPAMQPVGFQSVHISVSPQMGVATGGSTSTNVSYLTSVHGADGAGG